ncbi:MAG: polyprenyl synthetase family protein [Thermodesulfobacteriota bacterium]|nr:polyprenyl synthetase family protein [Thermodesulfobacteriota bacterium]
MRDDSEFLDQFSPYFLKIDEELGKIFDTKISLIGEVGRHSLLGRGKKLRPLFFILSCELCNYNEGDLYSLSTIFECVHVASLLHDDVLDNAFIRRGKSSANKIWGNSAAVLVGDFLFSRSSRIAIDKHHFKLLRTISDAAIRMSEGQVMELVNTYNLNMTKREYLDIITWKTAELISAACACGGILAGEKEENIQSLKSFGLNMGIAFQIIDDLFDYVSTTKETGKPAGNDIREGKVTLPLIYSLVDLGKKERDDLQDLFKSAKTSKKNYMRFIELVNSNGIIGKCREEAQHYAQMAESSLTIFPDSKAKDSLLKLNRFIVDRSY